MPFCLPIRCRFLCKKATALLKGQKTFLLTFTFFFDIDTIPKGGGNRDVESGTDDSNFLF